MAKEKYNEWLLPENLLRIQGWAMDGLIDSQIADNMGISYSTFKEWKNKHSAISAALKISKDIADRQIENALFKAAKEGNITAQIFWLKNRKPNEWREKQEIRHEGNLNIKTTTSKIEEYEELFKGEK